MLGGGGRDRHKRLPVLLALMLVLALEAGNQAAYAQQTNTNDTDQSSTDARLKENELQQAVMSFADRFTAHYLQGVRSLEASLDTPEKKLTASRTLFSIPAAIEIAAQASAGAALLDMVVFVTLSREAGVHTRWLARNRPRRRQ